MPAVPKKAISVVAEHLPSAKKVVEATLLGAAGAIGGAAGADAYQKVKASLNHHRIPFKEHEGNHDKPVDHHRVH